MNNTQIKKPLVNKDVIICGGGPVGLAMAFLLGKEGLSVSLFERRPSTTTLPKGQYLHASTGELFRQWGVWDLLKDAGWETEKSNGQGFYVTVADGPVAEIKATFEPHAAYVKKWEKYSPAFPRKVPASEYESALRHQASQWPKVSLNFNSRVIDVNQDSEQVTVTVQNTENAHCQEYKASYLVACDGAHSFIRSRLGTGQDHGPTFGNQILVEFRADLDDTLGKDGFFHSFVLPPKYAGWFGSKHPTTGLWRYSFRHDEDVLPPESVMLERIRGALGMWNLPIEIVDLFRFDYSTGLLRRWREGNVLFAGDAAHWHSPWGGFGMNSGIQDANNLAWKLGLVIKGAASHQLLDTYQIERESKARITVKSATYNSLHYQAIAEAVRVGEGQYFSQGTISPEARVFLEQRTEPHGVNSVLHTGYQLGTVYRKGAIIASDRQAPTPELGNYVETIVPGVRAPHAWLKAADGTRTSTIDLWGTGFVLIGYRCEEKWREATAKAARKFGITMRFVNVDEKADYAPEDDKFEKLYGETAGVPVLIRPDGFIAAQLYVEPETDAQTRLEQVMAELMHPSAAVVTNKLETEELM